MTNIASRGATMGVDWEQRIDFAKLRSDRLARAQAALAESDLGALLLFDPNNIRYVTSTHIGEWARDKNARFALLPRSGQPVLWDFGSAAKHHQLYAPWLPPENFRGGVSPMRGAMPDETGVPDTLAANIAHELREHGLEGEPVGIDMTDMVALEALRRAGVACTDGSQVMLAARALKTDEEILRSTPPLRMDWEIRAGTTDRLQAAYKTQGVSESAPLPESRTVNRTLYEEAVGHTP